jgi:hypothetical protein
MVSSQAFSQAIIVKGIVKSNKGEALTGVNVVVKGTTNGAISGIDGSYTLENVNSQATLVYSFIGFASQEVPVNSRTVVDVVLNEELTGLE